MSDYKVGYSIGCEVPGNSNTGNIMRNNIAYNCSLSGLFVGSNTTSIVQNTSVYNNTFYKCGFGIYDNGQMALLNNTGSVISNNIFYPTAGRTAIVQFVGTSSSNKSQSYNLYWRDNGNTDNLFYNVTGTETNAVLANPAFENASGGDFHIPSTSGAINAGNPNFNVTGQEDLDGNARIAGGRIDIGVDEFGGGVTTTLTASSLSAYNAAGGSKPIAVTSNVSWTARENTSWISLGTTSGSNNGSVAVTVSANTSTTSRSATVTISGGNITRSVTVSQAGANDDPGNDNDNLALNGSASQSSTAYNGPASRAIDGNTNGVWRGGSVTHTAATTGSWWEVELAEQASIDNIVIYNRTDSCCRNRLSNFTVRITNSNGNTVFSQRITQAPNSSVTINAGGATGDTVRITTNLTNTALSLAEVEVYGESDGGGGGNDPSCSTGSNLSLDGSIASFSTQQSVANGATNIIDGNSSNRWSAIGFPQYAVIDLGDQYNVNAINLAPYQNRAYQFLVEGSSNSASSGFSTLTNATGNTSGGSEITRTFSGQTVRYVRLTITGASGYNGTWSSIREFEVICSGNNIMANSNKNTSSYDIIDAAKIIYPNPFQNKLTVKLAPNMQKDVTSIRLVNLLGKQIFEEKNVTKINSLQLDLGLPKGFYIIQLIGLDEKPMASYKLIKN